MKSGSRVLAWGIVLAVFLAASACRDSPAQRIGTVASPEVSSRASSPSPKATTSVTRPPMSATDAPEKTLGPAVEWKQTDGRISAEVEVSPGNPRVGDLVRAEITASFKGGSETSGESGDGFNYNLSIEGIDGESNGIAECTHMRPANQMKSFERRWAWSGTYDEPGSYDVVVILSPRCIDDDSAVEIRRTLVVSPR